MTLKEAFILGEWWHSDSALDITTGIPLSNDTTAGVWQTHKHSHTHSYLYYGCRGAVIHTMQGGLE